MICGISQWYLIALDGAMVLRVRPGMPLGETEAGELSFDPSCAQLELDISEDGDLMLNAAADHELQFAGGTRCRRERLARDRRPEIRLPHHVLQLVTDFVDRAQANETVEIRAVQAAKDIARPQIQRLPDVPVGNIAKPQIERLPDLPVSSTAKIQIQRLPEAPLHERADAPIAPRSPPRTLRLTRLRNTWTTNTARLKRMTASLRSRVVSLPALAKVEMAGAGAAARRTGRTAARRLQIRSPYVGALIGLGAFALLYLLYPALREDSAPERTATASAVPAPQSAPMPPPAHEPSAVINSTGPGTDPGLSVASFPPQRVPLATAQPPATEPERREKLAPSPVVPLPESTPQAVPASQQSVQPRVERPSIPEIANVQTAPAEETVAVPQTIVTEPTVTVAAEPEGPGEPTQPQTVDLARTLFAADQALAQGQLMTPVEANAYMLYNRVLALDPASAEARSGLQSVRQGLINRAMAQLAGGALEDARLSLQAAADAGADPMLVINLREEVNYRQRAINASAEQEAGPNE